MEIILEANLLTSDETQSTKTDMCPSDLCCVVDCSFCGVDGDGSCGIDYN